MDDDTRAALRDLARQAEWASTAQGGAEAEALRLSELGRAVARQVGRDQDAASWAHRAVADLAAHCQRAAPAWSAEEITTLARLREAALIALAPGPGRGPAAQADATPSRPPQQNGQPGQPGRPGRPGRSGQPVRLMEVLRGRRAALAGLAVVACAIVAGIAVAVAGNGGSHGTGPAASATGSQAAASLPDSTAPTATDTAAAPTTPASATNASIAPTPPTSSPASGTRVTGIQMTATSADGYPEVQVYGTITASGTGDVTVTITVSGASGAPQTTTEDESGQTSYALSQTIYLQRWCGQQSVTVTVSSGAVSSSSTATVSGC